MAPWIRGPVEGECRRSAGGHRFGRSRLGASPLPQRHRMEGRPRCVVARCGASGFFRLRVCSHGGGSATLFAVHVRLDGKAQGDFAHHRRVHGLDRPHREKHVQSSCRRQTDVLVHRRLRLDHRAFVHRLRHHAEPSSDPHVRRRAECSSGRSILGHLRSPFGDSLLHRPYRDPSLHEVGRRAPQSTRLVFTAGLGHGGRAHQPRSVDVVPPCDWSRALSNR